MPQIPTDDESVFSQGRFGYQDIRVNPDAFGASVAGSLDRASDMVSQIALARQGLWNEKTNNDAVNRSMNRSDDVVRQYKLFQGQNAVTALDDTNKQLNDIIAEERKTLNPAAQRIFDSQSQRILRSSLSQVNDHWDQQFRQSMNDTDNASIAASATMARTGSNDPAVVNEAMGRIAATADRHAQNFGLTTEQKQEYLNQNVGIAAAGVAEQSLGDGRYQDAQGALKQYGTLMAPNVYESLSARAEAKQVDAEAPGIADGIYSKHGGDLHASMADALKIDNKAMRGQVIGLIKQQYSIDSTQRIAARQDVQQRFVDAEQSFLNTGSIGSAPPSQKELVSAFGSVRGGEYAATLDQYSKVGAALQNAKTLPEDQQLKLLNDSRPDVNTPNQAAAWKGYRLLENGLRQMDTQRRQDPAAWTIENAPSARSAYDNFSSVLGDPKAKPGDQATAAQTFAKTMLASQESIGAKGNILPSAYVDSIVQTFNQQSPDGKSGPNAAALIQSQASMWGQYWPQVYAQLQGKLPVAAKVIGSGMAAGPASYLAELSHMKPDELEKPFAKPDVEKVKTQIQNALKPIFDTTQYNIAGGAQTNSDLSQATQTLALGYMLRGDPSDRAVKRAADDVILGRYNFADSWRAPNNYSITSLKQGANLALNALTKDDVQMPGDATKGNEESYLNSYKANSIWVTSPNEEGLTLFNPQRGEVLKDKTGKAVSRTWQQLLTQPTPDVPVLPTAD